MLVLRRPIETYKIRFSGVIAYHRTCVKKRAAFLSACAVELRR